MAPNTMIFKLPINLPVLYTLSLFSVGALLFSPLSSAQKPLDPNPHGLISVDMGVSLHTGRTDVADSISGATRQNDVKPWQKAAFSGGITVDLGLPSSPKGMNGTVGMRFTGTANYPGPFFGLNVMARYRFKIDLSLSGLKSIEPWIGAGLGFHFVDSISTSIYLQFPIGAGCDFQTGIPNFYITSQLEINTINPMGPTWSESSNGGQYWYRPHYDSYMIKVGLAYAFY